MVLARLQIRSVHKDVPLDIILNFGDLLYSQFVPLCILFIDFYGKIDKQGVRGIERQTVKEPFSPFFGLLHHFLA